MHIFISSSIIPATQEAVQPLLTLDSDDNATLHLLGKHPSLPRMPTGNTCASLAEDDCPVAGASLPLTEAELKMQERNAPGRGTQALADVGLRDHPSILYLLWDNSEARVPQWLPHTPAASSLGCPRGNWLDYSFFIYISPFLISLLQSSAAATSTTTMSWSDLA